MFEQAYCSSSGGTTLYVYTGIDICHAFMLTGVDKILPTASQHKRMFFVYHKWLRRISFLRIRLLFFSLSSVIYQFPGVMLIVHNTNFDVLYSTLFPIVDEHINM
jgi:hypothetical protein